MKNIWGPGQHNVVQGKKKYVIISLKMDQYWFFSVYFALLFWIQAFFPYSNSLIRTHIYRVREGERKRERGGPQLLLHFVWIDGNQSQVSQCPIVFWEVFVRASVAQTFSPVSLTLNWSVQTSCNKTHSPSHRTHSHT